jgi:hypothetical protein
MEKKKLTAGESRIAGAKQALAFAREESAANVDDFLDFEPGTFDPIPHYAREEALGGPAGAFAQKVAVSLMLTGELATTLAGSYFLAVSREQACPTSTP